LGPALTHDSIPNGFVSERYLRGPLKYGWTFPDPSVAPVDASEEAEDDSENGSDEEKQQLTLTVKGIRTEQEVNLLLSRRRAYYIALQASLWLHCMARRNKSKDMQ
jgi:hypothetical protein